MTVRRAAIGGLARDCSQSTCVVGQNCNRINASNDLQRSRHDCAWWRWAQERELCATSRMLPSHYLALKDMMLRDGAKNGTVTRAEVGADLAF